MRKRAEDHYQSGCCYGTIMPTPAHKSTSQSTAQRVIRRPAICRASLMPTPAAAVTLSASLAALSVRSQPPAMPSSPCRSTVHFNPSSQSPRPHTFVSSPSSPSTGPAELSPVVPSFSPLSPSTSVRDCLLRFLSVQEWRARTYSNWHSSFRAYVGGAEERDLLAYTACCQHCTAAFQQLSLQVKLCIAHLQSIDSRQWAEQLQEVQRLEREKLGLTVAMQELTSEWVIARKEEFSSELQQLLDVRRRRMDELVEAINDIMAEVNVEVHYRKQRQ